MTLPRRAALGAAILASLFGYAAWLVLHRDLSARAGSALVLRIAHWQTEPGPQRALESAMRAYERLHPGVRLEQIAIPPRGYPAWLRTQLVGGTVPDIVQVGHNVPGLNDLLARYFQPLSELAGEPNPYNRGTPLEGVPLRDTVVDGMGATMVFVQDLQEYYSVPLAMFTVRVFYNRELWRDLLGDRPVPATYRDFLDVCRAVRDHAPRTGDSILPIAGSRTSGWLLLNRMFQTQTQRLDATLSAGSSSAPPAIDLGIRYLRGEWTFRSPGPAAGLDLMQQVSALMQPGFLQLEAGDALFQFLQGRALMILVGSSALSALEENASFPIGIFELPTPEAADPEFGREVLGPKSEASIGAEFPLALARASRHPDLARDFLQYLASQPTNERFAAESGWLPAIVGARVPEEMKPLQPRTDGVAVGFDTRLRSLGPEVLREVLTSSHLLTGPSASPATLAQHLDAVMPAAIRRDLARQSLQRRQGAARLDPAIESHRRLAPHQPASVGKLAHLLESQLDQECAAWWIDRGLRESRQTPRSPR